MLGIPPAQHEKHHASDQHDLNESESTFLSDVASSVANGRGDLEHG